MTTPQESVASELEPVLLELGKALFICQGFEGTLVLLLSTISHEKADAEDGAFTAAYDLFSEKTLGHLLKKLSKELEPLPPELSKYLTEAWNRRNWIVHQFLHEAVSDLSSPKGRLHAEAQLVEAKLKVKTADVVANKILDLYLQKYGISVASLKANADRLWEHMNRPASEAVH